MKTLKTLLAEGNFSGELGKIAKQKRFTDSGEAEDYIGMLDTLLKSPALDEWAAATDSNVGTKSKRILKEAQSTYSRFLRVMQTEM